jgi:hypothetical protein
MNRSVLTPEQLATYERDGFVMVRGLFDHEEAQLLREAMETDPQVRTNLYNRNDAQGLATKMVRWNHPGDSVFGLAARSHRIVDAMEQLLGENRACSTSARLLPGLRLSSTPPSSLSG